MLHDGRLFGNAFVTDGMAETFSETAFVDRFMAVEAELARSQADLGLIPEDAAARITETASVEQLDMDAVIETVEEIDLFTVAIITTWKETIGEAGEYIHWGATSQDVADTAMVLLMREGLDAIEAELAGVAAALEALAEEHADTPMVGRTHHVHALPMTFGLKAADWLDELNRDRERLAAARDRLESLQFFGAVGSLASLGEEGLAVQERLAAELDLTVPDTAWYASRDRFLELLEVFASLAGTLSRIARQVLVLGREEIGELAEPIPEGLIGSSTMPHKRNPVKSERTIGLAALLRGHAGVMHALTDAHDERDAGLWYAEYAIIPEAFCYLSRALVNSRETLEELGVNAGAMRENLSVHDGLVTSEAVMMALAETVGRQTAHEVVHDAAMATVDSDRTFREALADDDRITDALSEGELETLTDPTNYTGVSAELARRTVETSRSRRD